MVLSEAEAAAFLKNRGTRNSAEVIKTFDDSDDEAAADRDMPPAGI